MDAIKSLYDRFDNYRIPLRNNVLLDIVISETYLFSKKANLEEEFYVDLEHYYVIESLVNNWSHSNESLMKINRKSILISLIDDYFEEAFENKRDRIKNTLILTKVSKSLSELANTFLAKLTHYTDQIHNMYIQLQEDPDFLVDKPLVISFHAEIRLLYAATFEAYKMLCEQAIASIQAMSINVDIMYTSRVSTIETQTSLDTVLSELFVLPPSKPS